MEFKREIVFRPAYDKTNDPSGNYGVHGAELAFYLHGPEGVVQFLIYTNWHLKHVQESLDARMDSRFPHLSCHPMPADLGYHSPKPHYEGQTMMRGDCPILNGPCYYDGSTLNAEPVYWKLVGEGEEAMWKELEDYYQQVFATEAA